MDYRDRLIADLARFHCERIVRRVAHLFRRQSAMSSGGFGTRTVWDEICLQEREGESPFWWAYTKEIERWVAHYVDKLDTAAKQALWLQTVEGSEWECALGPTAAGSDSVPVGAGDIVEYITAAVMRYAVVVKNARVERYIDESYVGRHELDMGR